MRKTSGKLSQVTTGSIIQFFLAVTFLLLGLVLSASAHEMRPTIVDFRTVGDDGFELSMSLNLEAVMAEIGEEHSDTSTSPNAIKYEGLRKLDSEKLKQEFDAFAPNLFKNPIIRFNDTPAELTIETIDIPSVGDVSQPRVSEIRVTGKIPEGANSFVWGWPKGYGQSVIRTNYKVRDDDDETGFAAFFRDGEVSAPIPTTGARATLWEVLRNYVEIGFTHILPYGLDHILFVVGLFLLSAKLSTLLWQVTSFTLAHSVTLILGVLGVVQISPAIVEPLIAASIVYVCVENILTDKLQKWRPVVVFCFGLLHGLGFAGVLTEIGMAQDFFIAGLVAFNVGVELGQLAVIALCFLAVGYWFQTKKWYRERITIPASMVIAVIGSWWFVERVFLA